MYKVLNTRAELLFFPLDLSFCHVFVAVVVVICSRSLLIGRYFQLNQEAMVESE